MKQKLIKGKLYKISWGGTAHSIEIFHSAITTQSTIMPRQEPVEKCIGCLPKHSVVMFLEAMESDGKYVFFRFIYNEIIGWIHVQPYDEFELVTS